MAITNSYTVIPQQEHGLVVKILDNHVNIITKIETPYNSISKIMNDDTIVTLDKENKQLLFHAIDGNFIKSIDVPFGMAMNGKDSMVYVGGNARSGEVCYMVDMFSDEQALQNINLPVPMNWGKAVDDILIVGNKMMLIDNIVYPKYTFEYDISMPSKPVWVNTIELPHCRAYEHIIKGDMNDDWMIYLSTSSSGYTGDETHITIEGKYNNIINSRKKDSIIDICLIGDILYTLTDIGLGYFELNEADINTDNIVFIEHKIVPDRIVKVSSTQLLLVNKDEHELLDLQKIEKLYGTIMDRYWSYASLDLSDKGLTALPNEIKNLENLEHLDLSNNNFAELPIKLRKCKKLRSLSLYASGITEIPTWIDEFENMEYLNISGIDIGASRMFKPNPIRFPKNLKRLNLRYCQLFRIPPNVFKLKELEYLNLKENMLLWMPGKIGKLKNLKTLDIDWSLIYVSKQMGKLTKMHSLDINSGFRGKMPTFVYHMKQLKKLDASNADIHTIAPKIKNLVNIEYFDLHNNYDLNSLPDEIGDLKNLRSLNLGVCGLKELPQSIHKLAKLEKLDLSHNHLTELKKEDFSDMENLRELNFHNNKEKEPEIEIPEEAKKKKPIFSLPKYKIFGYEPWMLALWDWAKENDIPDWEWRETGSGHWIGIPRQKRDLKEFKELGLGYYRVEYLPKEIGHLVNLTTIDLKENNLKVVPREIGSLINITLLNLNKNKLKKLPNEIGNLSSLSELLLCNNVLTELPKEIGNLTNLTLLDVSFNRLKELPSEIGNLINLKKLDVGGRTQLKYLPKEIGNLVNLETLYVGHNQLVELPKEIGSLRDLKELVIAGNNLTSLPKELNKLTNLTKLYAADNPIKELPDLRNFKQLIQLRFDSAKLTEISQDIGELLKLTWLDLAHNNLTKLPDEITNLLNLKTLNLQNNKNLALTNSQEKWIDALKSNGCSVYVGIDE